MLFSEFDLKSKKKIGSCAISCYCTKWVLYNKHFLYKIKEIVFRNGFGPIRPWKETFLKFTFIVCEIYCMIWPETDIDSKSIDFRSVTTECMYTKYTQSYWNFISFLNWSHSFVSFRMTYMVTFSGPALLDKKQYF